MSTQTLLPASSHINDHHQFRSQSNDTRLASKNRLDNTSPSQRKRYKFSNTNTEQYTDIYKFPTNQDRKRSRSSDTNRYYFSLENSIQNPQQTLTYIQSGSDLEPRSVTFFEGSSTFISDTPYFFSNTTKSYRYPTTKSTYIQSDDTWTYPHEQSQRTLDTFTDTSLRTSSLSPERRQLVRMDTVTSTNGSLSLMQRSPTVRFESLLSTTVRSYLNEARERLSGKQGGRSSESFEKSVDRLVSSVNKKYGQQSQTISPSISSSLDYISQYYAKEDEQSIETDDEEQKHYYNLNTNRTHTQIMKSVNKSLIDRNYQIDKNRLKHLEQNVRRYLRLFENQSLQRELNYDLVRCFSSSYLYDLRHEEIRQNQLRSHMYSYTYEDIQDIYVPSILEAYKMKISIDREKHQRLQSSIITGQVSPSSSSGYSPIMIRSFNENIDTQSGGFETDRKSLTSISQISTHFRPNVDIFYEIMQESFRGVDASIASHVSKASQFRKFKSHQSRRTTHEIDTDVDIKSTSSFWSDDEIRDQYSDKNNSRKTIPHQRKISRYLSTVNRSLLDHPSDLIADFYLSQLNRNMQESVRNIELISRDKAYKHEYIDYRKPKLVRSLSAEHLYQVRKEHLRYKQPFIKSTSFTTEDVADIYKRFVLENYKRKIAIELERRRRQRQGQFISTSETNLTRNIIKSFYQPTTRNDFLMVSPPIITQTKEIIMGRARQTVTDDGSNDIIHHISSISPPPIYSVDKRSSSSETRIRVTATIKDQPDLVDQNEIVRTSSRPQTKIYTNISQTNPIQVCHANRIESESDSLSMVNIEPILTLNQYEVNCLTDQSYGGQIIQYIEQKPKQEQSNLIITINEHIPIVQEDISVIENVEMTYLIGPSITKANEISGDSGISLNTSHINEQPTILNPSFKFNNESLAEYEKTTIRNEIPYIDPSNESIPLASLIEELTTAIHKQHATQLIDDNYYWKTCEKIEKNIYRPIIVYDTEWKDEKVQILADEFPINIQNAQYKYPENIKYEYVHINPPYNFEIQHIINNNERVISLPDDSYLIRHQQQSNIYINELPYLENPLHSTDILTLNYANYNKKESNLSTISQTSSLIDMETFLNQFEESLDHEQHLPLVDQISISYATSVIERNQPNYRSLPSEWFTPTIISYDEQLVEQWTVEKNIDTIQQEGTLNRQQVVEFLTDTDIENDILATHTDAFYNNEKYKGENNDIISHCSPTSDYETDTVEKDNDTVTSTVIIPITILPSSSLTNTTLLSESSPLLTSHIAPIVYFLDVLALEQKEKNNSTKDFLLTIGFGQNQMNEITNTISTTEQPLRPTWITRSSDNIEILPTSIHYEDETTLCSIQQQQQIHFATENQLEDDNTALIIYPHYLQHDRDLGETVQAPLNTVFESSYLHLPMVNDVHIYRMSLDTEYPLFYPPDALPHILVSKIHEDELFSLDEYQINPPKILSYAQINYLLNNEEETQPISVKLDQPTYIEHYYIQSLFPFPETCFAEINQPEIISNDDDDDNNNNFLSNFILTKPIKCEDEDLINRFMGEKSDNDQNGSDHMKLNSFKSTSSLEVRPPTPIEPGPIYEHVKVQKHVDVNMGTTGQYKQQANYTYGNERDITQRYSPYERTSDTTQVHLVSKNIDTPDDIYVPEKIIEHISEDEKSTSSEEVVFEEWTEEFTCRRTDEYDGRTNKLLRTTIDETSDRIKGDVIKEEYKGKNTRIKGHKSYDVVKEVYRRPQTHVYEEIPPPLPPPPSSSISRDRQWTSEEVYTTEIVNDPNLAKELESTAQKFDSLAHYNRVHTSQYSPISSPRYDDKRKQDQEDVVTEEYEVEFQTPIKREGTSSEDLTDKKSPTKQDSDWRNKYKQMYNPPSDDDQHKNQINGNYVAQRVSVIPSNTQQRFKEVQIKIPGHDKTPPERRKFQPSSSSPSRHTVKEVLVCISRGSSPEKQYHPSLIDENEQKKKRMFLADPETPKKVSSIDDDYSQSPKQSPSSSTNLNERRTQYQSTDRPIYSRVGVLKNTFEATTTTNGSTKDETSKYKTPITPGLTEQRRRIFEEQEWTRRPINDFHSNERRMSETHTAPSLVSDRIFRIESSITKPIPQTSIDIKYKNKQVISSIDSDLIGSTQPIHQSTPKSIKQKYNEDAGHESEDELSDPKQHYDTRRRTSKSRLRDFSQSTSQPIDTTHTIQRTISKFNEENMENVLSHVPTSKGKGMLIELSPHTPQSPSKSNFLSDSGVFDYSTTTSHQIPISSPSYNDTIRSRDNGVYIDSTIKSSPYARRQISDTDQTTIQNVDDSISRSTYKYNREIFPNQQQQQQQQRTVRRQLTNSPPTNYEILTNYRSRIDNQGKVPITTQSRSIKPLVVDEFETVETETHVECNIQRTNEIKESTTIERTTSPTSPSKTIHITTRITDETTPSKHVLLNDKPQYYESIKAETRFQPIEHNRSQDNLPYNSSSLSYTTGPKTLEVTSLSPTNQIKFDKHSPNEIVATIRIPELSNARIRHGTSESNIYEKTKQEEERPRLHYQRVNATSYRPPLIPSDDQQRQSRSRIGPFETTNDYSSPINVPVRSASYHTILHDQNQQPQQQQQQQQQRSQTRYHSGSLGNLFGSNLEFEIEIEKRPPQQPEQPTRISLDQSSRAIITTSKDGRVSIQNVAAYPGNTIVINSDYHSSDRSLNRSSGYFSSDEPRSQGHTTNYSSDEQSSGPNQYSYSTSSPIRHNQINEQPSTRYRFDQVNQIVQNYSQPSNNFNETIDQIDALYNNLNIQTNDQRPYDFSKLNRRKQLTRDSNEYSNRYTSTGFQHIPYEQQITSDNNNNPIMSTPIRPSNSLSSSGILADYGTPGSISPTSGYSSTQYQNRSNLQSQIVQRNRTSVKQVKQKSAAKRRNGNIQGQYSDEDDGNDSPLSDYGRSQSTSRVYNFNDYHQ